METNLLDRMLSAYQESKTVVNIQLQNKVRVSGRVMAFDSYVIVIEGQKREIVYRHAVSSITAFQTSQQETAKRPAAAPGTAAARPARTVTKKSRPAQPQPSYSASAAESSLNNSMKEGLLKWMQEHKAAK